MNLFYCHDGQAAGKYHDGNDDPSILHWLHESTEACAETYIRELMPLGVYLIQSSGTIVAWNSEGTIELAMVALLPDEMQAFRTAVLRALIEVKK